MLIPLTWSSKPAWMTILVDGWQADGSMPMFVWDSSMFFLDFGATNNTQNTHIKPKFESPKNTFQTVRRNPAPIDRSDRQFPKVPMAMKCQMCLHVATVSCCQIFQQALHLFCGSFEYQIKGCYEMKNTHLWKKPKTIDFHCETSVGKNLREFKLRKRSEMAKCPRIFCCSAKVWSLVSHMASRRHRKSFANYMVPGV